MGLYSSANISSKSTLDSSACLSLETGSWFHSRSRWQLKALPHVILLQTLETTREHEEKKSKFNSKFNNEEKLTWGKCDQLFGLTGGFSVFKDYMIIIKKVVNAWTSSYLYFEKFFTILCRKKVTPRSLFHVWLKIFHYWKKKKTWGFITAVKKKYQS